VVVNQGGALTSACLFWLYGAGMLFVFNNALFIYNSLYDYTRMGEEYAVKLF